MFLKEVHDHLVSSELTKHVAGESGELNPVWKGRINLIIQAGIADLNKLFAIRENELLLRTKLGKDVRCVSGDRINVGFICIDSIDICCISCYRINISLV